MKRLFVLFILFLMMPFVAAFPGDMNNDKIVDVFDLIIVGSHFGLTSIDPGWDPRADSNGNGVIDIQDMTEVSVNIGKVYSCSADNECTSNNCECADATCSTRICNAIECTGCKYTDGGGGCSAGNIATGLDPNDACTDPLSCNGNGICQVPDTQTCTSDTDCQDGHFCECADATCSTRVCNAIECTGCKYTGGLGGCGAGNIKAGWDPHNACTGSLACDGNGDCQIATTYPSVDVTIQDDEVIVFNYDQDKCSTYHVPDNPANAMRINNKIHLYTASFDNYKMVGPDFYSLTKQCNLVMKSHLEGDPSKFNDNEWLSSPYIENGVIFGLVHHEYLGAWRKHDPNCTGTAYTDCYYASLTHVRSNNLGEWYYHPITPPGHVIAAYPYKYVSNQPAYGFRGPTNILKYGNYYYAMFGSQTLPEHVQKPGKCIMRTDNLFDPSAWRAWGGQGVGWNVALISPYTAGFDPAEHVCQPLENVRGAPNTLVWNSYLKKFMHVGLSGGNRISPPGVYFSLSDDLVTWSEPELLWEHSPTWQQRIGGINYATIIDPNSPRVNFDEVGSNALLFYTRYNDGDLDRDLLRRSIEFRANCQEQETGIFTVMRTVGNQHSVEFPGHCRPPGYRVEGARFKASGTQVANTHALHLCQVNNSQNEFVSQYQSCEGHTHIKLIGYVYDEGPSANAIYRCRVGSDHFISRDPGCEGHILGTTLGYSFEP